MDTSELISALKIHGSFPSSNDLFSDSDFLVLFNHQMKVDIIPMMLKLNEEYFVQYKDFTITQGAKYRIPKRAIGSMIRDLKVIDAGGNQQNLARLYEEDRPLNKTGYYIERNQVELSNDFTTGTLRMKYFGRPSTLVLTTDCAQITSIDTGLNQVVVSSVPSTMTTNTIIDFVQASNPCDLLGMDYSISGVSGTTISFSSLPDDLEEGDYICIAGKAPVPMVPDELHPVLIQSALCKTLSSKKDKSYADEMNTLTRVKEDAVNMLDPRVQNNSNKVRTGKLLGFFSTRRY